MADKMINQLNSGTVTSKNDVFLFQTSAGKTLKISWDDIVSELLRTGILSGNNITKTTTTDSVGTHITLSAANTEYTAGDGIDIDTDNTVSVKLGNNLSFNESTGAIDAAGGYNAGNGIIISDDVISVRLGNNLSFNPSTGAIDAQAGGSSYTAGTGIDISDDTISLDMSEYIESLSLTGVVGAADMSSVFLFAREDGTVYKLQLGNLIIPIITQHIGAGDNVTVSFESSTFGTPKAVISAADTTYTAGGGIDISSENAVSVKLGSGLTLNQQTGNIDVTGGSGGGSVWYFGNTQPVSANSGDYWLRTDTDHYGEVDNYNGSSWSAVGTFAGRDGDDGITPHIDSTTKHWFIGDTDTNVVAEGQNGSDGTAATVAVGTVTTGEPGTQASVTNSGTANAAVFDFVIPKGDKGDKGDSGGGGSTEYSAGTGIDITNNTISFKTGSGLQINSETGNIDVTASGGSSITVSDTLTLTAAGWQSKAQTVSVTLDTAKRNVIDITPSELSKWAECGVYAVSETAAGITFNCTTVPDTALTFRITSMEVSG